MLKNKESVWAGASIGAALAASLCCIGPLIAAGLGAGAFGAAALFESLRPYLLTATAVLLATAFYWTYRRRDEEVCADGACAVGPSARKRKAALWILTVATAALAAFPYYSGLFWSGASTVSAAGSGDEEGLTRAVFDVEGMTCAGCAATLKNALEGTRGVRSAAVSLEAKTAEAVYDPDAVDVNGLLAVMSENSFRGSVRTSGEGAR